MIIIEDEPGSPGERSPLKGPGNSQMSPTAYLPPPPYAATPPHPPPPHQSYQAIPQVPYVAGPLVSPRRPYRSPFKRFLKALVVALLVLLLWTIFLETLEVMVARRYNHPTTPKPTPNRGMKHVHKGMEWIVEMRRKLRNQVPGNDCPCLPAVEDTTPGRVLPIHYPPLVHGEEPSRPVSAEVVLLQPTPSAIRSMRQS